MRGANSHRSRRVMLLEDGVPLAYAPYSSPSIFSLLPMSRVVDVDVYRGPAAILYGPQTIGGAIDFRTREVPEGARGSVDATYGVNNFVRAHFFAGLSDAHLGALLEGTYLHSDGFQHIDGGLGSNGGFDLGDIAARAFVRDAIAPGWQHTLSGRFVLQLEDSRETYLGLTDADYASDPYRRYAGSALDEFRRVRTQAFVRYEVRAEDDFSLSLTAYRSDVARAWYRLDRFRTAGPSINAVVSDPEASDETRARLGLLTGARDSTGVDDGLVYVNNDWRYVSQGVSLDLRGHASHDTIFAHDIRGGLRVHHDSFERFIHADTGSREAVWRATRRRESSRTTTSPRPSRCRDTRTTRSGSGP